MTNTSKQIISSEVDYDKGYRFRLWVTAVEDSATLGMGFNAYHSHMLRSLHAWRDQGVRFTNPRDRDINFDALTKDDLFGFLGKKNSQMEGPVRNIKNFKVAIIDIFLKFKFPELCASFRNSDDVTSLRAAILNFHSGKEPADYSFKRLRKFLNEDDALFISHPRYDQIYDINDGYDVDDFLYYIKCFHFTQRNYSGTLNATRLEIPIHPNMVKAGSEIFRFLDKKQFRYEYMRGIQVFRGFGVPIEYKSQHMKQTRISCILRDELLNTPHFENVSFLHQIVGGKEKSFFCITDFIEHYRCPDYVLCNDIEIRYENKNWIYTRKFIKDTKNLINKIGSDI